MMNLSEGKRERLRVGIRTRIALSAGLAVLVAMGVAGVLLIGAQEDAMLAEEKQRVATFVESLAVPCAMALATNDIERLDSYLTQAAQDDHTRLGIVYVAMLDHAGQLMTQSIPRVSKSDSRRDHRSWLHLDPDRKAFLEQSVKSGAPLWRRYVGINGRPVMDVSMPAISGLRWGTLVATFDLTAFEQRLTWTRQSLILVAVLFTTVMFLAIYFGLSRIVVRPIQVLTEAVGSIEQGDLAARANVDTGGELGQLAEGFNAMAGELQTYTENLERKVEERSAEVRVKNTELETVNMQLHDAVNQLEQLARTDVLTEIYNRRFLGELLAFEIRRSQRTPHPLVLAMIDVDHFKRFNDLHGHATGDHVLRGVAHALRDSLRSTDIVARYGGEEFVAVLLDTERDVGINVAEKLRETIRSRVFTGSVDEALEPVTVSIGVAACPADATDAATLLQMADAAMYAAKAAGRNQVVAWSSDLNQDKPKT